MRTEEEIREKIEFVDKNAWIFPDKKAAIYILKWVLGEAE